MTTIKSPEYWEGWKAGMTAAAQIAVNQLAANTTVNNAQTCRAIKDKIETTRDNEPIHISQGPAPSPAP